MTGGRHTDSQGSPAGRPQTGHPRLVLVASRLPIERTAAGWRDSGGGGVAGLLRIVSRSRHCVWVGGIDRAAQDIPPRWGNTPLVPVRLEPATYRDYRAGFANQVLWPLYHDLPNRPVSARRFWPTYVRANQAFADAVARVAEADDIVWVHDYQLQLVPDMIRKSRPTSRIGFCLYTPFPRPRELLALPYWPEIINGMLGADLIGFQVGTDLDAFLEVASLEHPVHGNVVVVGGRRVLIESFPCSIDVRAVEQLAGSPETAREAALLRSRLGNPRLVLSSAERLDYTKGIDRRLTVLRDMLRRSQLAKNDVAIVQVAEPSRQEVARYRDYGKDVADRVRRINDEFPPGPLRYFNHHFDQAAMSALYRATDVMIVTPLRDGMNLVAKEYVASRLDNSGALVLSRLAGAAHELTAAYLVDPDRPDTVREGILHAVDNVRTGGTDRMARMRAVVKANDANHWLDSYLRTLMSHPSW